MGRTVQAKIQNNVSLTGVLGTRITPPGYLGDFGTGQWKAFYENENWTVPASTTSIRVRVLGGGSGGYVNTPGGAGGTSSFGNLISASGGQPQASATVGGVGGTGVGGSFQASGGNGGASSGSAGGGGGAAGTQLGRGGNGGNGSAGAAAGGGGGGVGGNSGGPYSGGSAFGAAYGFYPWTPGPDASGFYVIGDTSNGYNNLSGGVNPIGALIRFPLDGFTGGGGYITGNGGPGAGGGGGNGSNLPGRGGACGGGGGANGTTTTGGPGGYGGGGGGANGSGGGGGGGYAHGTFTVTPGTQYAVAVGAGGWSNNSANYGGRGLVVVEW